MELAPLPKDADDPFVPDLTEGAEAGLYLSLFELMNEGLIVASDETILEVNSAACRLMERSYRALAGQPLATLFASERAFLSARATLFIQGEMRGSLRVMLPGGRERDLAYVAAARIRPGVHALILSADPVTGHSPQAARAADTVWPRLAAALDQAALVIDARDHIIAANAAARRRFGATEAALAGYPLSALCTLSDAAVDNGRVGIQPVDGSPALHGRLIPGPEPGWRILLLSGRAPLAPVDGRRPRATPARDDSRQQHGATGEARHTPARRIAGRAQAIDLDMLTMRFQPVRDASTGGLVAAEALLRCQHPDFGLLGPRDFMNFSSDTDEDLNIGWHALTLACRHAAEWHRAGVAIPVAISVTSHMLMRYSPLERLSATLLDSGLPASAIELNLPENCLCEGGERFENTLRAIDRLGVSIAMTGIGKQPVPICRFHRLPIGTFKLDRELIRDLGRIGDRTVLDATISVARALSRSVQAVGVETGAQAQALLEMGCERQQGRLYADPMMADEFAQLL